MCQRAVHRQFAYDLLLLPYKWLGVTDSRVIPLRKEREWAYEVFADHNSTSARIRRRSGRVAPPPARRLPDKWSKRRRAAVQRKMATDRVFCGTGLGAARAAEPSSDDSPDSFRSTTGIGENFGLTSGVRIDGADQDRNRRSREQS